MKKSTGKKSLKILTPSKLLTRLPVSLAKKAGNNSYKLKSDEYYIFCISIMKLRKTLQPFNQVIIVMGVQIGDNKPVKVTEPKKFHFDLHKDVDKNLKHETGSVN